MILRMLLWYVCGPCKKGNHGGCNNHACVCCG